MKIIFLTLLLIIFSAGGALACAAGRSNYYTFMDELPTRAFEASKIALVEVKELNPVEQEFPSYRYTEVIVIEAVRDLKKGQTFIVRESPTMCNKAQINSPALNKQYFIAGDFYKDDYFIGENIFPDYVYKKLEGLEEKEKND